MSPPATHDFQFSWERWHITKERGKTPAKSRKEPVTAAAYHPAGTRHESNAWATGRQALFQKKFEKNQEERETRAVSLTTKEIFAFVKAYVSDIAWREPELGKGKRGANITDEKERKREEKTVQGSTSGLRDREEQALLVAYFRKGSGTVKGTFELRERGPEAREDA